MEHLRLLGVSDDGSHLLLEGPDGSPYALPLDERVHAALRGDRARLGQLQIELENQITPREIQARVRAGQSAEEIAHAAQVPVERVRRFEGPILLERQHIAELAQTTNVRRVTDSSSHPLSEVVGERLEARGVDLEELEWDARKREDGRWAVRLEYTHGGRSRMAVWLFDHQRRTLEPHDDEASWLIGDERAVPERARTRRGRPQPAPSEDPPAPPRLTAVPDVNDPADQAGPAFEGIHDLDPAADEDLEPGRGEADAPVDDTDRPEGPPRLVEEEPDNPLRPTTGAAPKRGGRRASVPSWDEILFGGSTPED